MTDRLVVVADNRSLSLGLTGLDYDVLDLRPDQVQEWLDDGSPAVLLIVGVEQPRAAVEVVDMTADQHPDLPVLLVASSTPGWDEIRLADERPATVMPLPVTRLSLVKAVQNLAARSLVPANAAPPTSTVDLPDAPPEPVAPEPDLVVDIEPPAAETELDTELHTEPEEEIQLPAAAAAPAAPAAPPADNGAPVRHMVAARSTDALRERLAHRAATAPPPPPVVAAMPQPEPGAKPAPQPVEARRAPAMPVPPHAVATHGEIRQLIQGLLGCVDELYDVRDAANAVVEECVAVAGAGYGVVLLPDEGLWRVCGGAGIRPLEWRYVVEPDSWLVNTVVEGDRGVIIEDSDIARQRLGGAPLAHHAQLLAAPIAGPAGLILVARDNFAFTENELSNVARVGHDAGNLLTEALLVRTLARALSDYRAIDE